MTTCVVVPSAEAATKPVKIVRRHVALDALREVIVEKGETLPETSTIPKGVRATTLAAWKSRWQLRVGYDAGHSADVAFNQDKKRLLDAGKVGISAPYVWTID